MEIIEFDGFGQPLIARFGDGTVAILVQGDSVSVVRIRIVPQDEVGPHLYHAMNERDLVPLARSAVSIAFPEGLDRSRHWILECPVEIAAQARFAEHSLH